MTNKKFDVIAFLAWTISFILFLSCLLGLGNHPATVITGIIWGAVFIFTASLYDNIH